MVLLLNSSDPTHASDYANIAFDVALLALDQAPQHFATQEDWLTRHLRPRWCGSHCFPTGFCWDCRAAVAANRMAASRQPLFIALALIDWHSLSTCWLPAAPKYDECVAGGALRTRSRFAIGASTVDDWIWGSGRSFWAVRRWQSAGR